MPYASLVLALTLVAGVAAGVTLDLPLTLPLSATLALAMCAASIGFARRQTWIVVGSLAAAILTTGWLLGASAVERALHSPLRTVLEQRIGGFALDDSSPDVRHDDAIVVEGRLRADAALTTAGAVLRLDVERVWIGPCPEATSGGISLGVGGALHAAHVAQWTAGRRVRLAALLRRPARYLNDGVPDMERSLATRGITLVGSVKSAALVEVVARANWWQELAARARARTRQALTRHAAHDSRQSAAIATAILVGDRAGLDPGVERRLQEAGTYHVIAISGGNIAILAGLLLAVLRWIGARGRTAGLVTIAVLAAYAIVAAGGASVARATLMAVIYLAVRLIDQRTAAGNAIGLTMAVLVVMQPLAVADVGFWLTFGATAAIVVGVSTLPAPKPALARAVVAVLIASASAELALAPIAAFVFQRVTLAGLVLNFAALPAMTVVQVGAMAVIALDAIAFGGGAAAAGRIVHGGSEVLVRSAALLDVAPWLSWRVPSPAVPLVAGYYAALVVTIVAWRRHAAPKRRMVTSALAATLFVAIMAAPHARVRALGDGRLHLEMIDVGQGDATLVVFPNGRRLVVDAGGTGRGEFDVGERVVGPALRHRTYLALDYVAVTHGDPDHLGGAAALVRDFTPREVWWGVDVANHEPTAALRAEAGRQRAGWRTLQRGDRLEIGGVELRVHHPPPPDWERQKVRNNDSLVMELRFGDVSVLLTGDIDREVERELLPYLDLLPTVVLKVAHHGSGTSSAAEFVERLKPAIALIGAGRANPYGHPVAPVLDRLRRVGTQVFRTDLDGQIRVTTDGRAVDVETFTGRRDVEKHEGPEGHEGTSGHEEIPAPQEGAR